MSERGHGRLRSQALAIACPHCGAKPGRTCREARWGSDVPAADVRGFRAIWREARKMFTLSICLQRYEEVAR